MRLCLSNFQLSPLHNIIAKENVNLLSQQSWMEEVLQEKGIRGIITNSPIMKKIYTQLFLVHSLASPLLLSLHQIHPDQFVPQRQLLHGSSFRPEYNFLLISRYNSPWGNSIRSSRDVEDGIKGGSIRYEKKCCHAQIRMYCSAESYGVGF